MVEEPSREECIEILKGIRGKYESHHKVKVSEEALQAAVDLSMRYINDRNLPDKAIDLIDEAASKIRLTTYVEPAEIKTLTEDIEKLETQKEQAIKAEAYEKAGDIKKRQQKKREKIEKMAEGKNIQKADRRGR